MPIGVTDTFAGKDRGQTAADYLPHLTASIRAMSSSVLCCPIDLQRTSRSCCARPFNRLAIGRRFLAIDHTRQCICIPGLV